MALYFVQAVGGGPIKIGFSECVEQRIASLRNYYGRDLVLLRTMKGGLAEEAAIHTRFAHLRYGGTEQFRPEADLLRFIDRPLFASNDPSHEEMEPARKKAVVAVPCTQEWKDWLSRLAAHSRFPNLAQLIDQATWKYAQQVGFLEEPPERS